MRFCNMAILTPLTHCCSHQSKIKKLPEFLPHPAYAGPDLEPTYSSNANWTADCKEEAIYSPMVGGPKMVATPWQKRQMPRPLTRRLRPRNSITTIVHRESFAAIVKPNITATKHHKALSQGPYHGL